MILTRASLGNPVALLVAVLLSLLFGLVSLFKLPVQLIPETQQPEISIATAWPAAAPHEVEAEILEPQEKVLKGLPGMTELLAKAKEGSGTVTVTFALDVPMERALVETINRLNQVPEYPMELKSFKLFSTSDQTGRKLRRIRPIFPRETLPKCSSQICPDQQGSRF